MTTSRENCLMKRLYFDEYCPDELKNSKFYGDSLKNMSFCDIEHGHLMNYIVVRKSLCPPILPCEDGRNVCEITAIQANHATCELRNTALSEMFQHILFAAKVWVNDNGNKEFDYLCFNIKNTNMNTLYDAVVDKHILKNEIISIGDMVYIGA